jgi:dolichyl-diphosphooligosaccharide--protein glycosyltransferase/undecaprenyl-diphosphooligosaccharide--protein glycosyltransferase
VYVVYQYFKKQSFQTNLILVAFMLFAMINVEGYVRFLIVLALFMAVKLKKELVLKYVYLLFGLSILVFIFTGGLDPIWGKLKGYVFKDAIEQSHDMFKLNFFSTMQTVRESGSIPLETFANRISGHSITFFASIVGYIWFAIRYPVMLMALPMVGLGFLAYGIPGLIPGGGLRFTVYAVPVMALGFGYLTVEVSKMVADHLHEKTGALARYALPAIFTLLALYPNIQHIQEYKVPTVFTQQEVKLLEKLHTIVDREDYAVTWWDYGYPIRYYSDMKTLIDGMKHTGAQNHNVSFMLSADPVAAAKLARLDVEYTEKRFAIDEANKELDTNHTDYVKWATNNIEQMMLDYGFSDANTFLDALETEIKLPSKTRDIYFYLPNRMMSIFPTVTLFSNLDLMSGGQHARPLFYVTNRFKDVGASIALGNGIQLIKQSGDLQIGNQKKSINSFITTIYDNQGKLHVEKQMRDYNSDIFVIYMRNYNQFLVLDRKMYDSLYIQLFVLENYDKNLFEPIMMDPMAKIYRLKI